MKEYRKDIVTVRIESGGRIYFINVVDTREGVKYVKISERTQTENGDYSYDKVIIYEDTLDDICMALGKMQKYFKTNKRVITYKSRQSPLPPPGTPFAPGTPGFRKNFNKPWEAKDDLKLEKLYCKRKTIEELALIFERTNKAIELRIKALGLEEKYDFEDL